MGIGGRGHLFLTTLPSVAANIGELVGYFGDTRTQIFGYPNCQVLLFSGNFRVAILKIRNSKNPNYSTRIFRVTRMPTQTDEGAMWMQSPCQVAFTFDDPGI